jgi:hypothetical protein
MITTLPLLLPPDFPLPFASTFEEEYLETLPDWDRTLFDGLILIKSCYGILLDHLRNALEFADDNGDTLYTLFVSDGSTGDDSIAFSWVLSMLNETILARCSGSAPGHESFDAAVDTKRISSSHSCTSPGHVSCFGYLPYKARTILVIKPQLEFCWICLMNEANGKSTDPINHDNRSNQLDCTWQSIF